MFDFDLRFASKASESLRTKVSGFRLQPLIRRVYRCLRNVVVKHRGAIFWIALWGLENYGMLSYLIDQFGSLV